MYLDVPKRESKDLMIDRKLGVLALCETKLKRGGEEEVFKSNLSYTSGVGKCDVAREGVVEILLKVDEIVESKGISYKLMCVKLGVEGEKWVFVTA